jgi:hypothetical protein
MMAPTEQSVSDMLLKMTIIHRWEFIGGALPLNFRVGVIEIPVLPERVTAICAVIVCGMLCVVCSEVD